MVTKTQSMPLDKMLQSQGFGPRKYCQQLIQQGNVSIAGQICDNPKQKIELQDLHFSVLGQDHVYAEKVYLALHKPKGYECSQQPTHHLSVFELIPELLLARGVQAVGRLDQDTTGLLLLSDDGAFIQALTHPKKHVPKVYVVETSDNITDDQISQLETGVTLHQEAGLFAATDVLRVSSHQLQMTIHQGVYHQVKRMLAAVGNRVVGLHRKQIGQLSLTELPQGLNAGEWCFLNEAQCSAARSNAAANAKSSDGSDNAHL